MKATLSGFVLLSVACASERKAEQTPSPAAPSPAVDAGAPVAAVEDPYLWLEEVTSDRALSWAKQKSAKARDELSADPGFEPLRKRVLGILDSKDKLPFLEQQGKYFYNFWRDDQHPKGLWRRVASLAEYKKPQPKWETVLDVDALAAAEKESWVFHGANCLFPKFDRCIVTLSRGGSDAAVQREFDPMAKRFLPDGFTLPEAKSSVSWKDKDTLYVGTDFGPGTLTDSGYPRQVKEWKRGTPLTAAPLVFEGQAADVSSDGFRQWDHGRTRDFVVRSMTFYSTQVFLRLPEGLKRIDVPDSAQPETWDDQLVVKLRDDWTVEGKTWPKGSLLVTPLDDFMAGKRNFTSLFEPAANKALASQAYLKTGIVTNELEDVHNKLYLWTRKKGAWSKVALPTEGLGSFMPIAAESGRSDQLFVVATGFTTPSRLEVGKLAGKREVLKQSPSFFDATGVEVKQFFATSKDGTRVPYFQVARSNLVLDGNNPTMMTGYGGFEISYEPYYDSTAGAGWLEKGGVFVVANIRGGGEYGPSWHQAALKGKRQNAYDDFIAVAEDLIARKVTSTPKLGIYGASNGGLLMGVMLTERPDLFGAIVCQVPLLDMKRYNHLLAGASWMAEYGDPGIPEEWAWLSKFSPYQNVKQGVKYPRTLFTTSTRDDRVHPGHARKMVARMTEWGDDVLYYENTEGGHGGAADNAQRAFMSALSLTFLSRQLGLGGASPAASK